jgi:hypothetical protein
MFGGQWRVEVTEFSLEIEDGGGDLAVNCKLKMRWTLLYVLQ